MEAGDTIVPPPPAPTLVSVDGNDRDISVYRPGMRIMIVGIAHLEKREAVITAVATSGARKGQLYVLVGTRMTRLWARNAVVISEPLHDREASEGRPGSARRPRSDSDSDPWFDDPKFAKGMQVRLRGIEGYEDEVAVITALGSGKRSSQLYVVVNGRAIRTWMENAVPVDDPAEEGKVGGRRRPSDAVSSEEQTDASEEAYPFAKGMKVRLRGVQDHDDEVAMITAVGSGKRRKQLYVVVQGRARRIWMENAVPTDNPADEVVYSAPPSPSKISRNKIAPLPMELS